MLQIEDRRSKAVGPVAPRPREIEVRAKEPFLWSEAWEGRTFLQWLASFVIAYGGVAIGIVASAMLGVWPELVRNAVMIVAMIMMLSLPPSALLCRPVGAYWVAALIERAFAGRSLIARPVERSGGQGGR